ncbi:hypothetical protein HanXRQr2_Chr16g0761341 [Helianthus annuus]|uniref:Uncharacterized protein n=1 Tax=Helianthus annuus TaxID=4232 RepID=A0A9K3DUS8_HELAN|nr:hypothetical protein HanXRQr2_Chr16g0761341 [Helianthus annuus]KAJ0822221.1 hypothetical protein HanPSC8_Chr16g0729471 [Helianthus annuus]
MSYPLDLSSPPTKSIETSKRIQLGMGKGCSKLREATFSDLALLHTSQSLTMDLTVLANPFQWNMALTL